jgi:hypothetical protein
VNLTYFVLTSAVLALGLYLFGHPKLASRQSKLVRGVAVWILMVLALRMIDVMLLP